MSDEVKTEQNDFQETFDDIAALVDEECIVSYRYHGKDRRTKIQIPKVEQILKVREDYMKAVSEMAEQERKALDAAETTHDKVNISLQTRAKLEQLAATWLKIACPSLKKKSDEALVSFIRKLQYGVCSPLVVEAKRACGLDIFGSRETPF